MIAARQGSPLAIGHGSGEMYLGSDAIALAPFTDAITYLEEGDWAVLRRTGVEIFDRSGKPVERPHIKSVASSLLVDKGNHRHFMAKEIHEQPEVISHTLSNYIDMSAGTVQLPDLGPRRGDAAARDAVGVRHRLLRGARRQVLDRALRAPAGGDRRRLRDALPRAAAAGRAGCPFSCRSRARPPIRSPPCATPRPKAQRIAAIVNVRTSTIARESNVVLPTLAGPEIGVASTKAFTCQLAVLACLAIGLGRARGTLGAGRGARRWSRR